jgi:uncharacterized protein GlcG (DUF336 family)
LIAGCEVIGAIGASFDTQEHDVQIAQARLAATLIELSPANGF